ncbi:MAG: hypothetical protein ABWZ91_05810 [Nocardioides sp.]
MADGAPAAEVSGWRTWMIAHLRSGQVSRVVYGSIIGLALILTLEAHPTSPRVAIGTLVATGLAVGLAELYSEVIGARTRVALGGEAEPLPIVLLDTVAVFVGIAFPVVFFIAAGFGLIEMEAAFRLAKWTGLALIAAYGYLAARLSGATGFRAVLHASGVAGIATLLIAFKALLH